MMREQIVIVRLNYCFSILLTITGMLVARVVHAQRPDTIIQGKIFRYYSSLELADSTIVFEYCRSITKNGSPNGEFRSYSSSGQLIELGKYRKGEKVGRWLRYFSNGKLEEEGGYKHGHAFGSWTWYYSNGAVKGTTRYIQQKVYRKKKIPSRKHTMFFTPKRYYPWFEILITSTMTDSMAEYYPDSKVKCKRYFDNKGREIDSSFYYYPSGQVSRVEYWNSKSATGCWKYYCQDGKLCHNENQNPDNPNTCQVSDEYYLDCDYYEIQISVPCYKGNAALRAKF